MHEIAKLTRNLDKLSRFVPSAIGVPCFLDGLKLVLFGELPHGQPLLGGVHGLLDTTTCVAKDACVLLNTRAIPMI